MSGIQKMKLDLARKLDTPAARRISETIVLILTAVCLLAVAAQRHSFRILMAGDSTMADKPLIDNPEHGWGQMLPIFFTDDVTVINFARNGRSTKSFIQEGRWQDLLNAMHAGDYVFIQFGHNDEKKEDTTRFADPWTAYKQNLIRMIRDVRAHEGLPILLTPVTRRDFDPQGNFKGTHGDYPAAMKQAAEEEHVPLIDMFEKSKAVVSALGPDKSKPLYLNGVVPGEYRSWHGKPDNTHFTRTGAVTMAGLAVEGIRELHLPLAEDLAPGAVTPLAGTGRVVGLDYYFNNEWRVRKDSVRERWHYVWEDTTNSGFSLLGKIVDRLGADLDTLQGAPTDSLLAKMSVYVIVDPDTPGETAAPQYVSPEDILVIERWVKNGGVLVMMENDKGNAEFEHFNKLAERFGIHFNEDSEHRVVGKNYDTGKNDHLPDHPIFTGVKQIFTKEVCTLRLDGPAKPVLTENGMILMAESRVGKGLVFAVGDPWLYNEYMDTRRLPAEYENSKAGKNLFSWLLENARPVKLAQ